MANIRDIDNTRQIQSAIRAGVDYGLDNVAGNVESRIDSGFETGTDALGRPWVPLAPSTIQKKGHSQILVEEGDMRASLFSEVDSMENRARIGFSDGTIRYHEFGVPENNLPARPVLSPAAEYASSGITHSLMATSIDQALEAV